MSFLMKKLLLLGLLFLVTPQVTNASVSVNIENSGGTNKVNIDSESSANYQQSGSTNIKTDVVVNQNGEKKEFHTTNGEDVNYQSSDGKTKVNINSNTNNSPKPSISVSPSPKTSESASPSADVLGIQKEIDEIRQENRSLMDLIKQFFINLSNIFKR